MEKETKYPVKPGWSQLPRKFVQTNGMGAGIGTVLLHDLEEFDDDFAGWSDQDLSFAGLFGVVLKY